jgi:transposase InsO family protein
MLRSMGSKGDAYDNALCEAFFATLHREVLSRCRFRTRDEARSVLFAYLVSPAVLNSPQAAGTNSPKTAG